MQAAIYDDAFIPTLSKLTGRVHENGGRIFAQLQHSGRMQGKGSTDKMAVGASNIPDKANLIPVHELTEAEVKEMVEKFVAAAVRTQKAGFDSIILAFGSRSDKALEAEYEGDPRIHSVGDCLKAGDAKKGIYEATKLAMIL